ncbi:hypothetical protein EMPG_13829 [Blastomyces silverae]|uniref:F-box domain-containing protein n=1 Tax=Blastomyces silverae TaxID=2060906 RepID=A0A0H1BNT9_9EURO|nr:hypothetical protein EMPG_13829 [Blastomyces silverae]
METFPPYEAVYPAFQPVAEGQRIVLDKGMDMDVVPSALCKFPKLAKLTLRYNMPAVEPRFFPMVNWLRRSSGNEGPLERHLKVIAHGIRRARSRDIHVRTVEFGGSNSEGWSSVDRKWSGGELSTFFSASLRDILEDVEVLRLFRSRAVLSEICTQPSFAHLREIDMCAFPIKQRPAFESFLNKHADTLRSIQYHQGSLTCDSLGSLIKWPHVSQKVVKKRCTFHPRAAPISQLLLIRSETN